MTTQADLYQIADELRAVANAGMVFCENGYDRERYESILKASARLVAAVEGSSPEEVYQAYSGNLAHLCPFLGVEAAVFREGKILLIQRRDDGLWAMPGGLTEVGESWAQAAERELWEEAGVRGKAAQLLGVFDSRLWATKSRVHLYIAVFLIESEADLPPVLAQVGEPHSPHTETLDAAFFAEPDLPALSPGHTLRVPMTFKLLRGEVQAPFFDK